MEAQYVNDETRPIWTTLIIPFCWDDTQALGRLARTCKTFRAMVGTFCSGRPYGELLALRGLAALGQRLAGQHAGCSPGPAKLRTRLANYLSRVCLRHVWEAEGEKEARLAASHAEIIAAWSGRELVSFVFSLVVANANKWATSSAGLRWVLRRLGDPGVFCRVFFAPDPRTALGLETKGDPAKRELYGLARDAWDPSGAEPLSAANRVTARVVEYFVDASSAGQICPTDVQFALSCGALAAGGASSSPAEFFSGLRGFYIAKTPAADDSPAFRLPADTIDFLATIGCAGPAERPDLIKDFTCADPPTQTEFIQSLVGQILKMGVPFSQLTPDGILKVAVTIPPAEGG